MKVLVLGAGLAGVVSAWCLRQQGFAVTVVEQLSASSSEQEAIEPGVPAGGLLVRQTLPKVRLAAGWRQYQWLLPAVYNRLGRQRRIAQEYELVLASYGRKCLDLLCGESGLAEMFCPSPGVLRLLRSARQLKEAARSLELLAQHEISCRLLLLKDEVRQLEPALHTMRGQLKGALYQAGTVEVDEHVLLARARERALEDGVEFRLAARVEGLESGADHLYGVRIDGQLERADCYLMTLGADARRLLADVGVHVPLHPLRSYSLIFEPKQEWLMPHLLVQDVNAVVDRPGHNSLRITGATEMAGAASMADQRRWRILEKAADRMFPGVAGKGEALLKAQVRHLMPDGLPLLGRTSYANLFLGLGLDAVGSVRVCGAARYLADLVGGRAPPAGLEGLDMFHH